MFEISMHGVRDFCFIGVRPARNPIFDFADKITTFF